MNPVLEAIHRRRSFSPRYLAAPGPDRHALEAIAGAAAAAPDHGDLGPTRVVEVPDTARPGLAEAFADAALELRPDADAAALAESRARAMGGPTLLAIVARIDPAHDRVPAGEQWISVGAAVQNMLLAAESLGFRGKLLSGARVRSRALRRFFSLGENEHLAAFLALGTPVGEPKLRQRRDAAGILSTLSAPARRPDGGWT
jgi:nitroreductase